MIKKSHSGLIEEKRLTVRECESQKFGHCATQLEMQRIDLIEISASTAFQPQVRCLSQKKCSDFKGAVYPQDAVKAFSLRDPGLS